MIRMSMAKPSTTAGSWTIQGRRSLRVTFQISAADSFKKSANF
jgi:hypothetical protein